MVVIVTGANGQLGQALGFIAGKYSEVSFVFCASSDLDITKKESVLHKFNAVKPDFCINAAAYTAVDKAESEPEKSYAINSEGVRNLAEACLEFNTILIHISTDFVFDGNKRTPYIETDLTQPEGVYAQSKLSGEREIQKILDGYFIVRTSWVYSQFGNNFMKTMLRLAAERDSLSVVNDQIGTPTHAVDLAEAIVKIVESDSKNYGIYHFSNKGTASWYDFAKAIFETNNIRIDLKPIPTSCYPTPAKRPAYSVLDQSKFKAEFKTTVSSWREALEKRQDRSCNQSDDGN